MIVVTRVTGNVGLHIVSDLLHTGAAVRSSASSPDTAGPPGGVVGDLEQQIEPSPAQTAPN